MNWCDIASLVPRMLRIIIAHSVLIILDGLGVRLEVLVWYICKV